MISAIIAVCVTYFGFPPIGYAGMVFISSVAVVLAIGAGGLSLLLAGTLILRRQGPRPVQSIAVSLLGIALAITYVWTM